MGDLDVKMSKSSEGNHDPDFGLSKAADISVAMDAHLPVPKKEGVFVQLKTTLETRAREKIGKVYVTGVPAKLASTVLNLVRKLVPDDGGIDFQHLRRFAKSKDLPSHVSELLANPSTSAELFLIAAPISAIPLTDLLLALTPILGDVHIVEVDVPMLAPTSQEQATAWTAKYWPTVYKKSNPFGPHPSIVERAEEEMRGEVGGFMELAERVASETFDCGGGERVGIVVVERREGKGRVVAVAGDKRWDEWATGREGGGSGNVFAHAVMRAIGMVAGGLKAREEVGVDILVQEKADLEVPVLAFEADAKSSGLTAVVLEPDLDRSISNFESEKEGAQPPENPTAFASAAKNSISSSKKIPEAKPNIHQIDDLFKDSAISDLEKHYFDPSGNENGYLCHELEIYCTHEPCVMCSMAIVHSRFGRVVFKRRMGETGGLCADGELGHGLFWRKELNWTLLGWQWICDVDEGGEAEEYLHA